MSKHRQNYTPAELRTPLAPKIFGAALGLVLAVAGVLALFSPKDEPAKAPSEAAAAPSAPTPAQPPTPPAGEALRVVTATGLDVHANEFTLPSGTRCVIVYRGGSTTSPALACTFSGTRGAVK